jgi:hypothetical protein
MTARNRPMAELQHLNARIMACRKCAGMNIPGVT